MKAHVEFLTGAIRVGGDDFTFGDPYQWSCTVQKISETTALIVAARDRPNHAQREAIKAALRGMGFSKVAWERRRPNGDVHLVTVSTEAR